MAHNGYANFSPSAFVSLQSFKVPEKIFLLFKKMLKMLYEKDSNSRKVKNFPNKKFSQHFFERM